jgi:hypothetical protein
MYLHVVDFWGLFRGKSVSYEVGSIVFICKAVQTKSGLQPMAPERHPSCYLSYRKAAFFCSLRLYALPFPRGENPAELLKNFTSFLYLSDTFRNFWKSYY